MDLTFLTKNLTQWLILICALFFLIYAAWIIKNEKKYFLKFARNIIIGSLKIKVPHWWSFKSKPLEHHVSFERTDTRYNWQSHFKIIKYQSDLEKSIQNYLAKKLSIKLDEGGSIFKTNISIQKNNKLNALRVESMGTQFKTERIYIDLLITNYSQNEALLAYSLSSVLNGAVEGPYFDEVLKSIELI